MLLCAVYLAPDPRRTSDSFSSLIPIPADATPTSHSPYALPSSVCRNSFVCHSYENCRDVHQQFPFWFTPPAPTLLGSPCKGSARHWIQVLSFHIVAHSFARRKTEPFYFQAIPHSLRKTPGVWGGVHTGSRTDGKKTERFAVRTGTQTAPVRRCRVGEAGLLSPASPVQATTSDLHYSSMPRVAVRAVPL